MKTRAIIIAIAIGCAAARTGLCADRTGTGSAAFLKLPVDARSASMGEASAASPRGAMGLFQNPAGPAFVRKVSLAFSHALLMEDISYDVLAAAAPLRAGGVVSAGMQSLRYGSFNSLDNTGAASGTLTPRDSAYTLGYARSFDGAFSTGVSLKRISSRIDSEAATYAMDAGFLVIGGVASGGVALQNMGKGLKFNKEESPLPLNLKMGVAVSYWDDWLLTADVNAPRDGAMWAGVGGEYAYKLNGYAILGRFGYSTAASDTEGVNGLAAGFGLFYKNFSFDYALRTMGVFGSTHHLGLTWRLGK